MRSYWPPSVGRGRSGEPGLCKEEAGVFTEGLEVEHVADVGQRLRAGQIVVGLEALGV